MKEELLDINQILLIKKVYNKFLSEKNKNEILTSSYAIFAEALTKQSFYSQQELTQFLGFNKAHTSRTLLKMQLKGLVKPFNLKDSQIKLTQKGQSFAKSVKEKKEELIKGLFENIDPEEERIFIKVLNKIIDNSKEIKDV